MREPTNGHDGETVAGAEGALSALFAVPSTREHYRELTGISSRLEHSGQYLQAKAYWQLASTHAQCGADRHWCDARAAWCARQVTLMADACAVSPLARRG